MAEAADPEVNPLGFAGDPYDIIRSQRALIDRQRDLIRQLEVVVAFYEPLHPSLFELARLRRTQ